MPRLIQMTEPPPIRQIVAIRGGNQEAKPVAAAKIVKARNKMAMGPRIQASMRLYLFTVDPQKVPSSLRTISVSDRGRASETTLVPDRRSPTAGLG